MSLDFNAYKGTAPFVTRTKDPAGNAAYHADQAACKKRFKADLLADLDIAADHPKADRFFELVWDAGHSSGYQEVYNVALDWADLMR